MGEKQRESQDKRVKQHRRRGRGRGRIAKNSDFRNVGRAKRVRHAVGMAENANLKKEEAEVEKVKNNVAAARPDFKSMNTKLFFVQFFLAPFFFMRVYLNIAMP